MAIYRAIQMSFWTDTKIVDDFSPEDRYFYLYLFTNPHTNLAGCYEISLGTMVMETGYSRDTIIKLIERMDRIHDVIKYSSITKEILILNWHKYNWTTSEKFRRPLKSEIDSVKDSDFRAYLADLYNGDVHDYETVKNTVSAKTDTVSDAGGYGIDTSDTDTVTVSVSDDTTSKNSKDQKNIKTSKSSSFIDYENIIKSRGLSEPLGNAVFEWIEYKKAMRDAYKEQGLKALLTQIQSAAGKYGDAAVIEIIQQSIANQYQGIVWDKIGKPQRGGMMQRQDALLDEWRKA